MPFKDKEKQAEYHRNHYLKNKEKITAYKRKWIAKNPHKQVEYTAAQKARTAADPEKYRRYFRNHRIKKVYGLTEAQYAALVVQQEGKCGICGKEPSGEWHGDRMLNVDHCHDTGKVRGLLCNACNRALGLIGDTSDRLRLAVAYLERFEQQS